MVTKKRPLNVLTVCAGGELPSVLGDMPIIAGWGLTVQNAQSTAEARDMVTQADFNVIIIDSAVTGGQEFAMQIAENSAAGIMLLTPGDKFDAVCQETQTAGVYAVKNTVGREELCEKIRLLAVTDIRMKNLFQKGEKAGRSTQDIKLINRAKLLLIKKLGLSEEKAHKAIEKQAMNTRRTKTEIAKSIIEMYEN